MDMLTVSEFCEHRLEIRLHLVYHHRAFMIAICALNLVFSLVAVLGNILIIRALLKASSIPTNLKTLFCSLAFSDLPVGFFAQLSNSAITTVILIMKVDGNNNFEFFCPIILSVCYFFTFFLTCASLLTITAITVDRLLSVSLHLRYYELVTTRRVVVLLVLLWVISIAAAFTFISLPKHSEIVIVVMECIAVLFTSCAYARIYKVVWHHKIRIRCELQQTSDHSVRAGLLRQQKNALDTFIVYVVFVVCYLPLVFVSITSLVNGSFAVGVYHQTTTFLIFLNSSLNPILYCWRYREIRQNVKSVMHKTLFCFSSGH
ncbi:adrenocorticotropic hormone receptor-like [Montipora foliosa]|uniref:adrenocorticotropic hormone receptor-like n=1 Tax=Montipora foliosa TaxID=591990 RepID=UPI0035F174C4